MSCCWFSYRSRVATSHGRRGSVGTALTRTRVVPASSPRGGRSSSSPRIVSALLPCVSGGQKVINREEGAGKGVVVRNSTTYRFSEDDDDAGPESRRPAHEHRHADTEAFQSAGTGVRLLGKARTKKRRKRAGRRLSCNKKEVLDSLCDTRSAAASCSAGADHVDSTAPRKWISLTLGRRRRRQQSGRRNTVTEGQDRGRSDLEMSLNDEQTERCWVQDVDLLRNDAVNGGNCTSAAISR